MDLVEEVIRREWDQFQRTENEGGRASCQGNWPMFHQMRAKPVHDLARGSAAQLSR